MSPPLRQPQASPTCFDCISASDSSGLNWVSHPRLSLGSCHTLNPCHSQLASSNSNSSSSSTATFVDHNPDVIFSSLNMTSGERIATHKFQSQPYRVLVPTLRLIIPSSSIPGFTLTLSSPISPHHPVGLPRHLSDRCPPQCTHLVSHPIWVMLTISASAASEC